MVDGPFASGPGSLRPLHPRPPSLGAQVHPQLKGISREGGRTERRARPRPQLSKPSPHPRLASFLGGEIEDARTWCIRDRAGRGRRPCRAHRAGGGERAPEERGPVAGGRDPGPGRSGRLLGRAPAVHRAPPPLGLAPAVQGALGRRQWDRDVRLEGRSARAAVVVDSASPAPAARTTPGPPPPSPRVQGPQRDSVSAHGLGPGGTSGRPYPSGPPASGRRWQALNTSFDRGRASSTSSKGPLKAGP